LEYDLRIFGISSEKILEYDIEIFKMNPKNLLIVWVKIIIDTKFILY